MVVAPSPISSGSRVPPRVSSIKVSSSLPSGVSPGLVPFVNAHGLSCRLYPIYLLDTLSDPLSQVAPAPFSIHSLFDLYACDPTQRFCTSMDLIISASIFCPSQASSRFRFLLPSPPPLPQCNSRPSQVSIGSSLRSPLLLHSISPPYPEKSKINKLKTHLQHSQNIETRYKITKHETYYKIHKTQNPSHRLLPGCLSLPGLLRLASLPCHLYATFFDMSHLLDFPRRHHHTLVPDSPCTRPLAYFLVFNTLDICPILRLLSLSGHPNNLASSLIKHVRWPGSP